MLVFNINLYINIEKYMNIIYNYIEREPFVTCSLTASKGKIVAPSDVIDFFLCLLKRKV